MAKMNAEERHKKQLEKIKAKDIAPEKPYEPEISKKDMAIEVLEKKGYKAEYASGVPIFHVTKQEDVDCIRETMQGLGSIGFHYPSDANIVFETENIA